MTRKLNIRNNLAYMGVSAPTPPNFIVMNRAPLATDYKEFSLGTFCLYRQSSTIQKLFFLASKEAGVSTWLEISGSIDVVGGPGEVLIGGTDGTAQWNTLTAGANITITNGEHSIEIEATGGGAVGAQDFITDTGTATIVGNEINIVGGNQLNTTGVGNTVTIELDNGTDGQVLIGGGIDPLWANLVAGTGIAITNAANSITIEATGTEPGDLPVGGIIQYDGTAFVDVSWSDCDGSAVSQTTYAALFAKVGHQYMYPTYATQTTTNTYNRHIVHNQLTGAEGLWVAVGGGISYSSDGTTWHAATSPFTLGGENYVAHNGQSGANGLWVVTSISHDGTKLLASSPDGITWTLNPLTVTAGQYFTSIVHNQKASPNGLWVVAISRGAEFYTSPDGITWTSRLGIGTDTSIYKYGLCFDATMDKFAAFSTNSNNQYEPPKISYKADPTDGGFWDLAFSYQSSISGGQMGHGNGMAIGNGKIMFSGQGYYSFGVPQLFVSDTATSYRSSGECLEFKSNSSSNFSPQVIGGDDDYGYAMTSDRIYYSSDGLSWTVYPYVTGGSGVQGYISMTSNNYAHPDRVNILNSGATIAVGKPAINTAVNFYLPSLDNKIIRVL